MATIHATSEVADSATIGDDTYLWLHCQVREGAKIGNQCILGKNVYVDKDVIIGNKVKIQNNVSLYYGVEVEDEAMISPHVCFTNDKNPRSATVDGDLKSDDDWKVSKTLVKKGASIGANATVICGVTIGSYALIGAGSVITKDVPDHGLVYGVPATIKGWMCNCGTKLNLSGSPSDSPQKAECSICGRKYKKEKNKIEEIK